MLCSALQNLSTSHEHSLADIFKDILASAVLSKYWLVSKTILIHKKDRVTDSLTPDL